MPSYYTGSPAGKTGTTTNYADAWFCGFDPKLATAVWMGYPQAEIAMPGVQGATYCVPIWGTFYNTVFGSTYIPDFATPAIMPLWKPWDGQVLEDGAAPSPSPSPSPSTTKTAVGPGTTTTPKPTPTRTSSPTPAPSTSP